MHWTVSRIPKVSIGTVGGVARLCMRDKKFNSTDDGARDVGFAAALAGLECELKTPVPAQPKFLISAPPPVTASAFLSIPLHS